MDGNCRVERGWLALAGVWILAWGWLGWGATLAAEGFWTTGPSYADWYWLDSRCHAQWDFFTLPLGGEPHVGVEAFVCLATPSGDGPSQIEVRFQIGTASTTRLWVARLNRVQANPGYGMYFGQLFLSRREIGLGSRLTVRLDGGQGAIAMGVHPASVRVSVGPGSTAPMMASVSPNGQGGSSDEVAGGAAAAGSATSFVRTLPASETPDGAPFLAPGTYRGTLGWAGPYAVPQGKGLYRVNLHAGEILAVRIETGSPCALYLLDPSGRRVGEIEGSSWLGLEYRAHVAGAWQLIIACRTAGVQFPYTLSVAIRRE